MPMSITDFVNITKLHSGKWLPENLFVQQYIDDQKFP